MLAIFFYKILLANIDINNNIDNYNNTKVFNETV